MTPGPAPGAGLCLGAGPQAGAKLLPVLAARRQHRGGAQAAAGGCGAGARRAAVLTSPMRGLLATLATGSSTSGGTQPAASTAESPKYLLTTVTDECKRALVRGGKARLCLTPSMAPRGDRAAGPPSSPGGLQWAAGSWRDGVGSSRTRGLQEEGARRGSMGGHRGGTQRPGCKAAA